MTLDEIDFAIQQTVITLADLKKARTAKLAQLRAERAKAKSEAGKQARAKRSALTGMPVSKSDGKRVNFGNVSYSRRPVSLAPVGKYLPEREDE